MDTCAVSAFVERHYWPPVLAQRALYLQRDPVNCARSFPRSISATSSTITIFTTIITTIFTTIFTSTATRNRP